MEFVQTRHINMEKINIIIAKWERTWWSNSKNHKLPENHKRMFRCANTWEGSVLPKQCCGSRAVERKDEEHPVSVGVGTWHFITRRDVIWQSVFSRRNWIRAFDVLLTSPGSPIPYYTWRAIPEGRQLLTCPSSALHLPWAARRAGPEGPGVGEPTPRTEKPRIGPATCSSLQGVN